MSIIRVEEPVFCICYTVIVPPFLFSLGGGLIYIATLDPTNYGLIFYFGAFSLLFIITGLYMCIYTLKEFIVCRTSKELDSF